MGKRWNEELVFTARPGLLLVDCGMENTTDWLRTIVIELTTCVADDIPWVHMVTVYVPKAAALKMEKLLSL